jgi:HD superfamily phosphohydrolase
MYRTVYWHRQVRAVTAMLKKALINGLETGQITGEDLYNLDDYSLFSLLEQKIKKINGSPINGAALVEYVREGDIYAAILEISPNKAGFQALRDVKNRAKSEEKLTEDLRGAGLEEIKGEDIIIDIPEPVSFETGLYITDEKRDFSDSSSAFKPQTVDAFIQTLYTIRVYINQKFKEKIKTFPKACSILEELLN